jgi:hypothetical protein
MTFQPFYWARQQTNWAQVILRRGPGREFDEVVLDLVPRIEIAHVLASHYNIF